MTSKHSLQRTGLERYVIAASLVAFTRPRDTAYVRKKLTETTIVIRWEDYSVVK